MAVRESEYIRWAKSLPALRYNLAASGVRPCPVDLLAPSPDDWALSGPNTHGWPPLLERLAARAGVEPSCVVPAVGTSGANFLACAATLGEVGDRVLIERPGYEPLVALARHFGAAVDRVDRRPEDGYRLDPDALRRAMRPGTRLVVVTNLHNPTGVLTPRCEIAELARVVGLHGARLLVDEVYLEWLPDEQSAATLGPPVIVTGSLTKAYGLDQLRAGWVIADPACADRIRGVVGLTYNTMPFVAERLIARALDRAPILLADVAPGVAANRAIAAAWVAADARLAWVPPVTGTVGFVRAPGIDVDALADRLRTAEETLIVPGRHFDDRHAFRLGLGGAPGIVAEGLRRVGAALARL
jgi:aspartate/methionine/tyrosine aminotransferase